MSWAWVSWARDTRHARGVKGSDRSEAIGKVKYDYIPEELATDRGPGDALEARG